MRIGIVGAGNIGGNLARVLTRSGHTVLLANSKGPDSLRELVAEIGPGVEAVTVPQAAAAGDLAIVTIPLKAVSSLNPADFAGQIVIDTCNYYPDRDGHFDALDAGSTTSSELVADQLSGSTIVKAFNTIYFERLRDEGRPAAAPADRLAIPVASDDAEAKSLVMALIDQIGFAAVDAGTLAEGARQQPGTPVYNNPVGPAEAKRLLAAV